jgi:hypothetical protein
MIFLNEMPTWSEGDERAVLSSATASRLRGRGRRHSTELRVRLSF